MAEIEYFVDPQEKANFPKFQNVKDLKLTLFSACNQMDGKSPEVKTLGQAVSEVGYIRCISLFFAVFKSVYKASVHQMKMCRTQEFH